MARKRKVTSKATISNFTDDSASEGGPASDTENPPLNNSKKARQGRAKAKKDQSKPANTELTTKEPVGTEQVTGEPVCAEQVIKESVSTEQVAKEPLHTKEAATGPDNVEQADLGLVSTKQVITRSVNTEKVAEEPFSTQQVSSGLLSVEKETQEPVNMGAETVESAKMASLTTEPLNTQQLVAMIQVSSEQPIPQDRKPKRAPRKRAQPKPESHPKPENQKKRGRPPKAKTAAVDSKRPLEDPEPTSLQPKRTRTTKTTTSSKPGATRKKANEIENEHPSEQSATDDGHEPERTSNQEDDQLDTKGEHGTNQSEPLNESAETPSERSSEIPVQQRKEPDLEKPAIPLVEEPTKDSMRKPARKTARKPVKKALKKPVEKPAGKPVKEHVEGANVKETADSNLNGKPKEHIDKSAGVINERRKKATPAQPVLAKRSIPQTYDHCDDADKALFDMREVGEDWETIKKRYEELGGPVSDCRSTLPNRYTRMKSNFSMMRQEDIMLLMAAKLDVDKELDGERWPRIAKKIVDMGGDTYTIEILRINYNRLMGEGDPAMLEAMAQRDATNGGGVIAWEQKSA